jgi:hypothetical protein
VHSRIRSPSVGRFPGSTGAVDRWTENPLSPAIGPDAVGRSCRIRCSTAPWFAVCRVGDQQDKLAGIDAAQGVAPPDASGQCRTQLPQDHVILTGLVILKIDIDAAQGQRLARAGGPADLALQDTAESFAVASGG